MSKVTITLCLMAVVGLFAGQVLAGDVSIDLKGSRMAAGYVDPGAGGAVTKTDNANYVGSFNVPDAKLRANAKFDETTTAVMRISLNNGTVGGTTELLFVKVNDVLGKIMEKAPLPLTATVGRMKVNFGEETWANNSIDGVLVTTSIFNVNSYDEGLQLDTTDLVKSLPLILNASFALLNGNAAAGADTNQAKAYNLKVSGQMRDQKLPLSFSLSYYSSDELLVLAGANNESALSVMGMADNYGGSTWNRKAFELDVRYDLLEGDDKWTPTKAPFLSDSKAVVRLAYGNVTDGEATVGKVTNGYVMLEGIYNINDKWYAALRYSYNDAGADRASTMFTAATDPTGKWTRTSVGVGTRLSGNTALKAEYTMNAEPDTTLNPEIDNDQVALLITTSW
ncbi:MAG: hypothetical protein HY762_07390 [Planctomycetes bacterium]|nr:hypothetical protein [Planctomycetota bacterium]